LPGNETDPYDLKPIIENPKGEKQSNKEKDFEFDRKKFYTISKKGITTYELDQPVEYISLNDWIHD